MRSFVWIVPLWLASHVLLVLASVLEVFLYSILVAPGLPHEAYEAHAQLTAPWVSVLAGGPLFFAWGRVLRGRFPNGTAGRPAAFVWGLYTLIDFLIVTVAGGWTPRIIAFFTVSQTVKAVAIALGVRRLGADVTETGSE